LPKPIGVTQVNADIRDRDFMNELFAKYNFRCVFDLASYTVVGLSAKDYQRNVENTEAMIDMVTRYKTSKYMFYSTQFVYRKNNSLPKTEEDYAPADAYGESKVQSEKLIRDSLPRDQWLILRPSYVWGPGLERFRDGLLYRLAKKQLLLPSDTTMCRYYGYVETVAAQTYSLYLQEFSSLSSKVYYLSDDAIQLHQFSEYLVNALEQGGAWRVPSFFIRLLGLAGELLESLGMSAPINTMQARELTTIFPIPIQPTIDLTHRVTDYANAAAKTVKWALENQPFARGVGRHQ
jgi:GlcNAc-P-P-Und epimerase